MVMPGAEQMTLTQLEQFSWAALLVGTVIHGIASLIVGLLFGLLLPAMPGGPLVWGGLVGPLLWSGLVYAFMSVLNPVMNRMVDWPWFIASQFAFGLAAGLVVFYTEKVQMPQPPGDAQPENVAQDVERGDKP